MVSRTIYRAAYRDIPDEYRPEFFEGQAAFIKKRVRLFCILAVSLYFFSSIIWFFVNPGKFFRMEVVVGLFLLAGGAGILLLNAKAKTIRIAKVNAYLFTMLLIFLLVRLGIAYGENVEATSAMFVFTLFFVSLTIPWTPLEVIVIWFLHIAGYTVNTLCVKLGPVDAPILVGLQDYLDGFIFIAITFFLCIILRAEETRRDIESFMLVKEVENKNEEMNKELEWARRIHRSIIPDSIMTDKIDIGVSYIPMYYIGGDYVKFEFLSEDKLIFIMSDVTGHGVPAALLVNRVHAEFERLAKGTEEPGALLRELNIFITEDFEGSEMYLSAFCGLLDLKKKHLIYSNYGHPPQYIYREKEAVIEDLPPGTTLLGLPIEDDKIYQDTVRVEKGDRILLFTDGVTEAMDKKNEEYGSGRLGDFLRKNHTLPVEKFNNKLIKDLSAFTEGKFKDDICILSMEVKRHKAVFPWQK